MSGPRHLEFNPLARHQVGSIHWWAQRGSAILLIPTTVWLIFSLIYLSQTDYIATRAWFAEPINAILMAIFTTSLFCHLNLGLRTIIEDYVRHPRFTPLFLLLNTLLCWILGVLSMTNIIILVLS